MLFVSMVTEEINPAQSPSSPFLSRAAHHTALQGTSERLICNLLNVCHACVCVPACACVRVCVKESERGKVCAFD